MSPSLDMVSVGAVAAASALFAVTIVVFAAEWSFAAGAEAVADRSAAHPDLARVDSTAEVPAAVGRTGATALLERPGAGAVSGRPVSAPAATPPAGSVDGGPARARKAGAVGMNLTGLATVVLGVGVVTRGIAGHRVPWGNLYEFSITGSFVVVAIWLVANRRHPLRFLAIWLVGFATTCLGAALLFFYENVGPLRPQLRSAWLVIHVSCAIIATGAFTVGAVLTVLYLLRSRAESRGVVTGYLGRLPASAALDRMAYRLTAFAFPIWTAAVIFGAIWAQAAYGQFWEWDPKETWSLISWVVYAAYLHARATAGWRGRLAATIALVAFATVLFNLVAVNFLLAGKHSYAS